MALACFTKIYVCIIKKLGCCDYERKGVCLNVRSKTTTTTKKKKETKQVLVSIIDNKGIVSNQQR
jgi:hypothetical protein